MRILIGFILIAISGPLTAVTGFPLFAVPLFVGIVLFASIPDQSTFTDYVTPSGDALLVRKRYYIHFLPFTVISYVLTLGKAPLKIVYKEEYYRATNFETDDPTLTKLPRAAYIAVRDEARRVYSTHLFYKDFMQKHYSPQNIGLERKKTRLIVVSILAALMLLTLTVPSGIFVALPYEVLFVSLILLWTPEYKDAKILQQAYDRAIEAPKTQ